MESACLARGWTADLKPDSSTPARAEVQLELEAAIAASLDGPALGFYKEATDAFARELKAELERKATTPRSCIASSRRLHS